jgi:C4-dicarboxylate transporter, DctM subunit
MSASTMGVVGVIVLIIFLFSGMPVAFGMAIVGFVGIWIVRGSATAFQVLPTEFYTTFSTYTLSCVPMFVLMGTLAGSSGISKNLYATGYAFVGHLRGGLALATTLGCALFAAITGSSAAEAAAMAKVALPEMKKYNYDSALATGSIAAAGSLAILIPPSMGFIVYGFLTQVSVGRLFIAGIVPGVILTTLFMVVVWVICLARPTLGPAGDKSTWKVRMKSLGGCIDMVLLFLLVIGGLFVGIFTPTEGGAVGAGGALILCLVRKRLNWQGFLHALKDTAVVTSMIFVILASAFVFGRFTAYSGLTLTLINWLSAGNVPPYAVLWMIFAGYAVAGCFMDFAPLGALTIPTLFPIVTHLGFDPVWFGVFVVVCSEMALITPPVGMNVFVINAVVPEVPLNTIYRGAIPFVIAEFILFLLLLYVPQIAIFLPNLMMGQ